MSIEWLTGASQKTYGELVSGTRTASRPSVSPLPRYMQTRHESGGNQHYDMGGWAVDDRGHRRSVVKTGMRRGEENRSVHEAVKREKRKQKYSHPAHPPQPTIYICHKWDRGCHARVGLISHSRKCWSKNKTKNDFLLFWNIYLFLCSPLYRFFIPHFDLFTYFFFLNPSDILGGTKPLSFETEECLVGILLTHRVSSKKNILLTSFPGYRGRKQQVAPNPIEIIVPDWISTTLKNGPHTKLTSSPHISFWTVVTLPAEQYNGYILSL